MADATDIRPNYAFSHPLEHEDYINQLLSSMLLQHHQNESHNQIDHMESAEQSADTPKRRQANSIFSLTNILSPFCNKGWKRLIASYGLVTILLFTLQQMILRKPPHLLQMAMTFTWVCVTGLLYSRMHPFLEELLVEM